MKNTIRTTITGLIYQGQRALPGVQANLAALGYSAAQGAAFAARIMALIAARDTHATAKVALGASRVAHNAVVKTAREVVMNAKDGLKMYLGREHSDAWIEAGFPLNLAAGEDGPSLLGNVQGLKAYYTAHSEHENAAANFTAARFDALATDLIDRIAVFDAAKSSVIAAADDRDAKAKLVREELRMLLAKLTVMFDPFAAMWETVGFNRPGFVSVPPAPLNVIAVLTGPTSALLDWDQSDRADRYRIYKKVVGVDEDFVLIDTRADLDFNLVALPANATTQVVITALNSGGESARSEVVTITTH